MPKIKGPSGPLIDFIVKTFPSYRHWQLPPAGVNGQALSPQARV
jgi:hypothetical protein